MITRLSFMQATGYLTRLLPMKTNKTERGYFISWNEGIHKDKPYQRIMILSIYKDREGVLRGNYRKNKLQNIYIIPELVSDVVEALAKIFEEHFGVDLVGQKMGETLAGETESADVQKTVSPIPEKKEDDLGERLAKLGRVK